MVGSGSGRGVEVVVGIGVVVTAMRWAWGVSGGEGTSDRENGRRDKKGVSRRMSKIVGVSAYAVRDVGVVVVGVGLGDYLRVEERLRTAWVMLPTRKVGALGLTRGSVVAWVVGGQGGV